MRVSLLAPLLLLSACGYESPTWMPAGYAYHNDYYKAQPGPEADTLGYDYTDARNEYLVGQWADLAGTLVTDLENKTGMTPQTLYVEKLPESNAFNLSLDNALRDELRERGYTLTDTQDGVVHLNYQAFKAADKGKRYSDTTYNGEVAGNGKVFAPEKPGKFTFVLTLVKDGAAFGEIRREQILPAYGYVAGQGNVQPAPRAMEQQQQAAAPVSTVDREGAK